MTFSLIHSDARDALKLLAQKGALLDSVVTDPPYHLTSIVKRFGKAGSAPAQHGTDGAFARASRGFMGKTWDGGDIAQDPEFWGLVLAVMKPGAHLVAFGGTRTYHRMACAIEDAGFEVRDSLAWLYGSGMPKSHDAARAIDKHLGRKGQEIATGDPVKRMIPGADQNGTGSWIKDNGRTYTPNDYVPDSPEAQAWDGWGTALKPALEPIVLARKPLDGTVAQNLLRWGTGALNIDGSMVPAMGGKGRWPANVLHDGSEEVEEAFERFGTDKGAAAPVRGTEVSAAIKNTYGARERVPGAFHGDTGSASRFFYCAKANAQDRAGSLHPTVKPQALMRWLIRLVTPPGGLVLDPFAGSGSTGEAAVREGRRVILVEREADYAADIRRRMAGIAERAKAA